MWQGQKSRRDLAVTGMTEKEFANTLSFLEEAWEEGAKEAVALAVNLCSTRRA